MAAVDLQTVTSNLLKLDSSPLNHASAVIDELKSDTDRSEEVSLIMDECKDDKMFSKASDLIYLISFMSTCQHSCTRKKILKY